MLLSKGERIISNDDAVAEAMNEFFVADSDYHGINENLYDENQQTLLSQTMLRRPKKFSNNPGILEIKVTIKMLAPSFFKILLPIPLIRRLEF